jgi:hypothetical protein
MNGQLIPAVIGGVLVNAIEPELPAEAMKTYTLAMPLTTHWRPATCAEVDCPSYLSGWRTTVDERTELGQRQAHYIRHDRTRKHTEDRTETGLTMFTFEPGQRCFTAHRIRTARPQRHLVRGGDWRGNPRGEFREHTRPDDWVEDFAEHQDKLATRLERG